MKKITVFLILSLLTCPAISEDVAPWPDRHPTLTPTFEWDFLDENWSINGFPDGASGINNFPNGTPFLSYWNNEIYYPSTGPGPGGAISCSELWFEIPITSYVVQARVQVTYDINYGCPDVYFYSDLGASTVIYEEIVPLADPSWAVKVLDIKGYAYAPGYFADLFFSNDLNENTPIISEIVVDIIPEPSTMLLLAFGGLVLRKR